MQQNVCNGHVTNCNLVISTQGVQTVRAAWQLNHRKRARACWIQIGGLQQSVKRALAAATPLNRFKVWGVSRLGGGTYIFNKCILRDTRLVTLHGSSSQRIRTKVDPSIIWPLAVQFRRDLYLVVHGHGGNPNPSGNRVLRIHSFGSNKMRHSTSSCLFFFLMILSIDWQT